jgi:Protein of unknown function (DUF3179)
MIRPIAVVLCGAALVFAGCGSGPSHGGSAERAPGGPPSFDRSGWKTDFSRHAVPLSEFTSGGPPRDGIPPIDRPRYQTVDQADRFLADREPVIFVQVGGAVRAYPVEILVWHEIVNDRLGGAPVAVTYCPLCNSALVFDRRVGARTLTFGTTGNLRRSDLVMWDRQTQSWWQQIGGAALVGRLTGTRLRILPSQTLSWGDFKERFPQASVLSRDTGFHRDYGRNPYTGYDRPDTPPFLYQGRTDPRFPPKQRVITITVARQTAVVSFSRLRHEPVIHAAVGRVPVVVLFKPGVASPLDKAEIGKSRDVGTAAAFDRRLNGRVLEFEPAGAGKARDRGTGSTWDITGQAVDGPLRGQRLVPVIHDEQFWFAVAAFLPRAKVLG